MRLSHRIGNALGAVGLLGLVGFSGMALSLYWSAPSEGEGLSVRYFRRNDFKGLHFDRVDGRMDFYWANKKPVLGLNPDNFSAIWTGCVEVPTDGLFLVLETEGAVRGSLDGRRVLEAEGAKRTRQLRATGPMTKGSHDIELRYQHHEGPARFRAAWATEEGRPTTLPPGALRPGRCTK